MNTEILCVKKIGENKYFNSVFNFTGTLNECEDFARQKNFGGGVEILNKKMTLKEIKSAVKSGKKVFWSNEAYEVILDSVGQWLIKCNINGHCIGLTKLDGKTMNENEEDFFIEGKNKTTARNTEQEKIIHDEPAEYEEVLNEK